jgi:hypothetical protein
MCASADIRDLSSRHRPVTRVDRFIWPLWAASGLLTASALVLGLVLAVLLPGLRLFPAVSRWLLIPCIVLDLCSLYILLTGILRGRGPSAIPLIAWFYYVLYTLLGLSMAWWWRLAALAGLTLFHVCCYFLIPEVVRRRTGRR